MDLFSADFICIILPLQVLVYYNIPDFLRIYWLIIISVAFIISYNWTSVCIAFLVAIIAYTTGNRIANSKGNKRQVWLGCGVLGILILLIVANLNHKDGYFNQIHWIGLSYYGLMSISYLIDVSCNKISVIKSFFHLLIYTIFFPQLTAGPVNEPGKYLSQFDKTYRLKLSELWKASKYIIYGLFCKLVVADRLGDIIDTTINHNKPWSMAELIISSLSYSIQLYFDFSGYSHLVIGIALLFGIQMKGNFNSPYLARTTKEFWKRWHISLSDWFRTYLYIPLGGNKNQLVFPLIIFSIFSLSGLWHGFKWTFVLWGAMHAFHYLLGYYAEKFFKVRSKGLVTVLGVFQWILFLLWINLTWIVFRADSLQTLYGLLNVSLGVIGNIKLQFSFYWLIFSFVCLIIDHSNLSLNIITQSPSNRILLWKEIAFIDFWLIGIFFLAGVGPRQFLYFNF